MIYVVEGGASLGRTFYCIVSTFCETNDATLRFLHEKNDEHEDDGAIHTANSIAPPPTKHR